MSNISFEKIEKAGSSGVLIDTGFNFISEDFAEDVIEGLIGQLSDGMWENSPRMEKFWRSMRVVTKKNHVCIFCSTNYGSGFYDMDEDKIAAWIASKIKAVAKEALDDGQSEGVWDRNNKSNCPYFHGEITIQDAYKVYDRLKGRIDRI